MRQTDGVDYWDGLHSKTNCLIYRQKKTDLLIIDL